jgi:GDP-L-fucose synthase
MHFIFDLIRKIIRGKEFGDPVILWGDGHQKRELVLVGDFVRLLWILAEKSENEIFNIGAGREYAIREFAGMICDVVGYPHENIIYDIGRYVGARSKCLNTEKLEKAIPNLELTSLQNGIDVTVRWFYETSAFKI